MRDDGAAAGRRRDREHLPAEEGRPGGLALGDLVGGEVVLELGQQLGDRAGAAVADRLERRDVRVGGEAAGAAVDVAAALVALQDRAQDAVEEGLRLAHVDAGAGELERGRGEVGPRQAAEPAVGVLQPGEEPRHGDGAPRRRGRPASRRRRSRSRSPPSRRAGGTGRRRSSRARAVAGRRRGAGSRRRPGR